MDDGVHFLARSDGEAAEALAVLRDRVAAFDASLPVWDARRVEAQLDRVLVPQRLGAFLLGLLSAVVLLVSAVGIYGMVAFGVRRRTREIGIRVALGAPRGDIATRVAGVAATAVLAGLALGTVASAGLTSAVGEYLIGVSPLDPASFAGGVAILGAAAALATVVPLRRALAVDPRRALVDEEDG